MCSVSTSRSAPATGTPSFFSARMIASNSAPRWRTRISTSWRAGPALRHSADMLGDALGELHRRRWSLRSVSNGASQRLDVLALVGLRRIPDLDQARRRLRQRLVHRRFGQRRQAGMGLRRPEHRIDGAEHVLARAERVLELRRDEVELGAACAGPRSTRASPRIRAARRPGTRRSTASRRRPRRWCACGRARPRRRRTRRPAPSRCPIAWGSCPAPRRSAHDRCRGRACSAPRRPTRC